MAFDGSGTFNRTDGTRTGTTVWADAKTAGVKILSADHDTHDQDIADGLEKCLTVTGETVMANDTFIKGRNAANSADVNMVKVNASDFMEVSANVVYPSGSTYLVAANTSDASDNSQIQITGGGAATAARGPLIQLSGNEHANDGLMLLQGSADGNIEITAQASRTVAISANGTTTWTFNTTGNIDQNATNGGDIVFSKANTGVLDTFGGITAAGTVQGDATAITTRNVQVSGSTGAGVILPVIAAGGETIRVYNATTSSDIKIYPGTGETIGNETANVNITISAQEGIIFFSTSSSGWGVLAGLAYT
jgi:hypothetical protein